MKIVSSDNEFIELDFENRRILGVVKARNFSQQIKKLKEIIAE